MQTDNRPKTPGRLELEQQLAEAEAQLEQIRNICPDNYECQNSYRTQCSKRNNLLYKLTKQKEIEQGFAAGCRQC